MISAMAISETHGFGNSSYGDVAWATTRPLTDARFTVADLASWKPTRVTTADRTISVAPGWAQACGVASLNGSPINVVFAANNTASTRVDALVARFDWAAATVTFVPLSGGTIPPTINTSTITPNPAQINRIPGKLYDALVGVVPVRPSVGAFNQAGDLADMRIWGGVGGPFLGENGLYTDWLDVPQGAQLKGYSSGLMSVREASGWSWGSGPRGELGYAARYTQAGPVTTGNWVTTQGLEVNFTIPTARKIKSTLDLQVTSNVGGTFVGAALYNTTTGQRKSKTMQVLQANYGYGLTIVTRVILPAGSYQMVGQQTYYGGPGGAYFTADPQEVIVEDIGTGV
jgi:hypothetical protein